MDSIILIINSFIELVKSNIWLILFNISILISITTSLSLFSKLYHEQKVYEELHNLGKKKKNVTGLSQDDKNPLKKGFFGMLYKNLNAFLTMKEKEKSLDMIFYIIIIISLLLGIAMFSTGQKLFGVIIPFALCFLISYVLSLIKVNRVDKIREQLPAVINNLTRVMTKYSSLKTILYETASTLENPMRDILKGLSLKMSSESGIDVLTDFMEEYNDIWIYSFAFTLQSYLEDSEKTAVISNLKELRDIIEKEIERKKAEALEKKMTVMINYVLVVLGVIAEFANIMFNPGGAVFFFKSMGGFACFIIGNGLLITCVISNILLTKK